MSDWSFTRDGFTVSTERARLDMELIHRTLSQESYWAPGVPRAVVERAFAHALPFGLYGPDGAPHGFARVTSDYATNAHLQDVFVLQASRGRGLSRLLLDAVFAHPRLQNIRRWTLTTRDAHGLYAKYGFAPVARPESQMERVDPDAYRRG